MEFLDIRTVILSQLLIQLVCALVLFLLWRDNRARYDGLGLWVMNAVLQLAGLTLVMLRGHVPDLLSMVGGNTLALGSITLLYSGLSRFAGLPALNRLNLYALAVFALIHSYFSVVDVSFQARNLNFNAFLIFYSLRIVVLLRGYPEELRKHATAVSHPLMAFAGVSLARIALVLSGEHGHDFMRNCPADTALFLLYSGLVILLAYGLFIMVNRRLLAETREDYEGRIEAEKVLTGALRVARLGTWRWDVKTNELHWSDEMYSIFGIDKSSFTGDLSDVVARAIHPSDRAAVEASNAKVIRDGSPAGLAYRVLWADGSLHWVYAEASELSRDADGAPAVLKGYAQDITELKLTEERLRESAGRLELAQASAGMGSWYWDIKENKRHFDAQVCRLLGLEFSRFGGSAEEFFAVVHPDDKTAVEAALDLAVDTGKLYSVEYRVVWADGGVHYVAARGRLRRDEAGLPWRIDGLLWDITERKTAEVELKASEERFQKAFHAAPFLMSMSVIETGRYIEVNDKFCEVSGFSREELIGRTSAEVGWISSELRDELRRSSNGVSLRIPEITLTAKGGRRVVCSYAFERLPLSGKNIMVGVGEDLTDRKRAEEALKASEEYFRTVVEIAPDAIFIQSGGRFVYLNSACCRLFGISEPGDLVGRGFIDRIAPKYRDLIHERMRRQVETGAPAPLMEQEYLRVDGTTVPVETTAVRIKFRGEDAHLVFVRDISSRKREEEVMQSVQRLESLGTLAGGIAHDFNNLLTGITGNLSLMRSAAVAGENIEQLLAEAESACLSARALARQLLTFASGGEPLKKPVDIAALLRDSVAFSLRGSSSRHSISGGEGLWVLGDREQLFQVFQNLVLNAAQAMAGGGEVTVKLNAVALRAGMVPSLGDGMYLLAEIRDTGGGIPAEIMRRIFEPYFSTKAQGRGLGLAVCRSVVVKHGGTIAVASEPGKGSVFGVYLPLTDRSPSDSGRTAPAPLKVGSGRVLIMDDEEVVYKALRRMLGALGYESEVAADGRKALEAWAAAQKSGRPFFAAIMDLTIPGGMGGAEAVKLLKASDNKAKVLVSSGYSEDPIMSEYAAYGFDGVLAKPYRVEDLSAALSKLLT